MYLLPRCRDVAMRVTDMPRNPTPVQENRPWRTLLKVFFRDDISVI